MKKITIIVGVVSLEIHRGGTCEEEVTQYDYDYYADCNICENCDEID